jgi:hypothetical protein
VGVALHGGGEADGGGGVGDSVESQGDEHAVAAGPEHRVDREAAELGDAGGFAPVGGGYALRGGGQGVLQGPAGFGSFGEPVPGDGHGELLAAGVLAAGDDVVEHLDAAGVLGDPRLQLADLAAQRRLGVVVGPVGAFEPGEVLGDLLAVHQQRVAGGDGLDLVRLQGLVADVLDLPGGGAAHDLVDEGAFAGHGLPGEGVEAAGDDVAVDADLGVLVALAQDASLALGDVGRAPRAVEVVQGDRAGLDVGADAHLGGRADEHGDVAGAAGVEQAGLLGVSVGLVDVADLLPGHPPLDEQFGQGVVGVPALGVRGGLVAEDDLQRRRGRAVQHRRHRLVSAGRRVPDEAHHGVRPGIAYADHDPVLEAVDQQSAPAGRGQPGGQDLGVGEAGSAQLVDQRRRAARGVPEHPPAVDRHALPSKPPARPRAARPVELRPVEAGCEVLRGQQTVLLGGGHPGPRRRPGCDLGVQGRRAQRQGRSTIAGRVDPFGDLSRDLVVAAVRHRHEARSSSGSPAASTPCARNRSNSR